MSSKQDRDNMSVNNSSAGEEEDHLEPLLSGGKESTEDLKRTPGFAIRVFFLLLCLMYPLGSQAIYDTPACMANLWDAYYGIDSSQFGLMYSMYAFPNFLFVFFVGPFVDRAGPNWSGLTFSLMIVGGCAIMWSSGKAYIPIVAGFTLFGLGAGSILVSNMVLMTKWFKGSFLAMAFGFNTALLRLQSTVDYNLFPVIAQRKSVHDSLTISFSLSIFSLGCMLVAFAVDRYYYPPIKETAGSGEGVRFPKWADIKGLSGAFWFCLMVATGLTAGDFLYEMYGPKMIQDAFGVDEDDASRCVSAASLATVIATPLSAWISDKWGHYPHLMTLGASMEVVGSVLMLFPHVGIWSAYLTAVLIGTGYAISTSVVWVAVVKVVDDAILGTSFSIMSGCLNLVLFILPYIMGYLQVWTKGYFWSKVVVLVIVGIGLAGGLLSGLVGSSRRRLMAGQPGGSVGGGGGRSRAPTAVGSRAATAVIVDWEDTGMGHVAAGAAADPGARTRSQSRSRNAEIWDRQHGHGHGSYGVRRSVSGNHFHPSSHSHLENHHSLESQNRHPIYHFSSTPVVEEMDPSEVPEPAPLKI